MNKTELIEYLSGRFQLTGSRFMSNKDPYMVTVNPSTDWDFVTYEGSEELASLVTMLDARGVDYQYFGKLGPQEKPGFLERLGMAISAKQAEAYMPDASTRSVLKCFGDSINIIVKTDDTYPKYLSVFERMTPAFYRKYIWKSSPENSGIPKMEMRARIQERIELLLAFQ
jgi:hypothetical protein